MKKLLMLLGLMVYSGQDMYAMERISDIISRINVSFGQDRLPEGLQNYDIIRKDFYEIKEDLKNPKYFYPLIRLAAQALRTDVLLYVMDEKLMNAEQLGLLAHQLKSEDCMRYALRCYVKDYDALSLVQKWQKNNFMTLIEVSLLEEISKKKKSTEQIMNRFDRFFATMEQYIMNMDYFSNFQMSNSVDQIRAYNQYHTDDINEMIKKDSLGIWTPEYVEQALQHALLDVNIDHVERCLAWAKDTFRNADSEERQDLLDIAYICKHHAVLRMLHFYKPQQELKSLYNAHIRFE